ncbi:MAG: amidase [Paracoccaceae bacterium]
MHDGPSAGDTPRRPDTQFTGPDLCALTAREVIGQLRRGEVSPAALIDAAEARSGQVGAQINAMPTTCFGRARERMEGLPHLAATGETHPGWMAGLPIAIKDLNLVEGVRTTFGNPALANFVPTETDPLIERLEERGALVVGKTNTPEFGAGGNSTNPVLGATCNPWDTRMNAGGSSGGAAASLAAGEVWLAQGSDLMGSLRTPAAHCSVVSLRPSPGRAGGGPASTAFLPEAVQGPMARDVLDCALFLDAMCGYDPRMPLSMDEPAEPFQDLATRAPRAPRIAFTEDQNGFSPVEADVRATLRTAMHATALAGAEVEDVCPDLPGVNETYLALRGLHYGAVVGGLPAEVQATFGERLKSNLEYGQTQSLDALYVAMRQRTVLYEIMRKFLQGYDVLALPVVGIAPAPVEQEYPTTVDGVEIGTYETWLRFSFLSVVTLLPSMSIPAGFTPAGLPVGLQLIGPPRGEATLLQAALFIERALGLSAAPIDPIVRH